jgi:hypothetical protein
MRRSVAGIVVAITLALPSCTIDAPFDPATLLRPGSAISRALGQFGQGLDNPFNNRPTPVLLGGDAARIFYATDLTDIEVRFDGPTNDIVLPGFLGPSNVYAFEDGNRTVVRRLVTSGALWRAATDGENVAFVQKPGLGTDDQQNDLVLNGNVLMTLAPGDDAFFSDVVLVEGTLVAAVQLLTDDFAARIHVFDALSGQERFLVSAHVVSSLNLLGDQLVYWIDVGSVFRLIDFNVVSGENATLVERTSSPIDVVQSANRVVWSEEVDLDHARVVALDRSSGEIKTLAETVSGRLAGATDSAIVIEETFTAENDITSRIAIRRQNDDGSVDELANIRADRRAGQTIVVGDRAVFVNDDQKIVVVPLNGGERFNFQPF